MFIIVDKNTNKITQTIDKNYGIEAGENKLLREITDETLASKINTAHDYTLIFDTDGNVADITVTKTLAEWQAEQALLPQAPTPEERLSALEDAMLLLI